MASLQACDEYGNKRKQGGDAFKASIRGFDADAASITDRGDGSYALRYCLPSEGAFSLCVTGPDGKHLRGSPATLTAFRYPIWPPCDSGAGPRPQVLKAVGTPTLHPSTVRLGER